MYTLKHNKVLRNDVPDTATGKAFVLRYTDGHIEKKSCFNYKLVTDKWPAGNAGWEIMPTPSMSVRMDCPDYPHLAPGEDQSIQ